MKRTLYNNLINWKLSTTRKPLALFGANTSFYEGLHLAVLAREHPIICFFAVL